MAIEECRNRVCNVFNLKRIRQVLPPKCIREAIEERVDWDLNANIEGSMDTLKQTLRGKELYIMRCGVWGLASDPSEKMPIATD